MNNFPKIAGLLVTAVGSLITLGWYLDLPTLKLSVPGFITMKANIAVCFIFAGLSLWLVSIKPPTRWTTGLARGGIFIVTLTGLLTLTEIIFDLDLGIDQWLFSDPSTTGPQTLHPGQMAPPAALNLVLIGSALWCVTLQKPVCTLIIQIFTYLVIVISSLIFIGFLYGVQPRYTVDIFMATAPTTAVLFLLLGVGILSLFPHTGFMAVFINGGLGGYMARRLTPAMITVLLLIGWLRIQTLRHEWIGAEFGTVWTTMAAMTMLVILIWHTATSLNRIDTAQKQKEAQIAKLHRFHHVLSQVNQAIVSASERNLLFYEICRILVEQGNFRMVWIGIVDKHTQLVQPVAKYGVEEGYLDQIKISVSDSPEGRGPTGRALREGKRFICTDFEHDSCVTPWREKALQRGYRSSAAFPIRVQDQLVGVMTLYASQVNFFDEIELHSIQQVVDQLTYALAQGKDVGLWGLVHEIAERKRVEDSLQQANVALSQFKMTLDLTLDAVFILDADTLRFTYANQGAVKQVGYSQTELLQMTVLEIKPEFTEEQFRNSLLAPLVEGDLTLQRLETVNQHKDGRLVPVEIILQYIQLPDQRNCIVKIARDITLRKQIEATLQEAKERAEQANRAKSLFLANMSHELRTPLNGILGFTQLLQRDPGLSVEQKEQIKIISQCGEHLLTMITDILDLSKIEADKMELTPTTFHLEDVLKGVVELFAMRAQQKGIVFSYEPLSQLPIAVYADEKRLRQILINLLSNSIKFTPNGKVCLKVGYYYDKIYFQVIDTGIGIAPADLDKIFLPFQQVGDPTYHTQGTGLGLAITKKLVELMGGKLQVVSIPKEGSSFWLVLTVPEVTDVSLAKPVVPPIIIGYQRTVQSSLPTQEGEGRREETGEGETGEGETQFKILIADDKWENRIIITQLLTPLGFDIAEASDGQVAVVTAQQWHPDVILMDLMMPVMNGFEATQKIRNMPELKNVIIIAVSASVFESHQQESTEVGCNDFIPKPLRFETLLDCLQKYLPLTWIYDQPKIATLADAAPPLDVSQEDLPWVVPSVEQLTILANLTKLGDIQGILDYMGQLEQTEPQLVPFTTKVSQLANGFQKKQILELVKQYLG